MPVDASAGKSEADLDKYAQRSSNFYTQTVAENNARLLDKFPNQNNLRSELEFIQAAMLIAGPP